MATIIKGSTKRGQQLIARAENYEGYYLDDVYGRPSTDKLRAWEYCWDKFVNTEDNTDFGICSHNTFQFSVSWYGKYNGENAIFLETANNSYIILLDK